MRFIRKSALTVVKDEKLLLVKPKVSSWLLMPGGKPKEGESAVDALKREIGEELGCGIEEATISFLGRFEDKNADGTAMVAIDLYSGKLLGEPRPCSEIEELVWVAPDSADERITPVTRNKIMPFLLKVGFKDI